jgi:hypothetical protein
VKYLFDLRRKNSRAFFCSSNNYDLPLVLRMFRMRK